MGLSASYEQSAKGGDGQLHAGLHHGHEDLLPQTHADQCMPATVASDCCVVHGAALTQQCILQCSTFDYFLLGSYLQTQDEACYSG